MLVALPRIQWKWHRLVNILKVIKKWIQSDSRLYFIAIELFCRFLIGFLAITAHLIIKNYKPGGKSSPGTKLTVPGSWISKPSKQWEIDFYCLCHPVCGISLWQPEQTKIDYIPRRIGRRVLKRYLYTRLHRSIIHNS